MNALNCKPGDLAVVVRSQQGNEGRIVRCLRLIPEFRWVSGVHPSWEIDVELHNTDPRGRRLIPDYRLRPLRDPGEDARDETLDWKALPVTTKDAA